MDSENMIDRNCNAKPQDYASFLLLDAEPIRRDEWRVEVTNDFPFTLLDADAGSAEAVLTPSGVDWFDLGLGVRVGGQRIGLVPALRRLLSSPGENITDLLARPAESGATLPVTLGDGRVIAMDADQAIDRAHRIGQMELVFVYRIIAAGTVEEKILELQERKAALAEALWSEDPSTPAQLSEDDIAFLLG